MTSSPTKGVDRKVQTHITMSRELFRRLKAQAALRGTHAGALLDEAVAAWLASHERRDVA